MLMEKEKENKEKNKLEMNCLTNNSNNIIGNNLNNYMDKDIDNNESKLEAKQVEDLKDCVNKILNEF